MILLHVFAESPRYARRQAPLHRRLHQWGPGMARQDLHIWHQPTGDDLRYEQAIRQFWGRDDLLIVEGDMLPTRAQIQGLRQCPHPVCTQHYVVNAFRLSPQRHRNLTAVHDPESRTWYSGLGCFRLRRDWMRTHPPTFPWGTWNGRRQPGLPWGPWPQALDWRLTGWISGPQATMIHVHYPDCRHFH